MTVPRLIYLDRVTDGKRYSRRAPSNARLTSQSRQVRSGDHRRNVATVSYREWNNIIREFLCYFIERCERRIRPCISWLLLLGCRHASSVPPVFLIISIQFIVQLLRLIRQWVCVQCIPAATTGADRLHVLLDMCVNHGRGNKGKTKSPYSLEFNPSRSTTNSRANGDSPISSTLFQGGDCYRSLFLIVYIFHICSI